MPKGKKHTTGDYDGWILRLIDKVEDLQYSFNLSKWLDFAASKIESKFGYHITEYQASALAARQDMVWEIAPKKLNVQPEYVTLVRYRGRGGRYVDVKPQALRTGQHVFRDLRGRFARATPVELKSTRYRDLATGRTLSRADVNSKINSLKAAKEWETWD